MTSKLKCPVCNHKLYQTASEPATYCCLNKDCTSDFKFAGSKELWQALIQSQKKLDVARQALDKADRFFEGTIGLYQSEMMAIIKTALEQIEHIADISNMIEHKE